MNLCRRAVCGNVVPYSVLKKYAERCADNVELDRQTRNGTSHFCLQKLRCSPTWFVRKTEIKPQKKSGQKPPFSYKPNLQNYLASSFFILSIASTVLSLSPKAVSLNQPSPFLPKPAPGVPTTFAFSRR